MADAQLPVQYLKLADAAHDCDEAQWVCEEKLWRHANECPKCKNVGSLTVSSDNLKCGRGSSMPDGKRLYLSGIANVAG